MNIRIILLKYGKLLGCGMVTMGGEGMYWATGTRVWGKVGYRNKLYM